MENNFVMPNFLHCYVFPYWFNQMNHLIFAAMLPKFPCESRKNRTWKNNRCTVFTSILKRLVYKISTFVEVFCQVKTKHISSLNSKVRNINTAVHHVVGVNVESVIFALGCVEDVCDSKMFQLAPAFGYWSARKEDTWENPLKNPYNSITQKIAVVTLKI